MSDLPENRAAVCAKLATRFGARATTNNDVRRQHAVNAFGHTANQPADIVVFVESEDEVVEIVKLCHATRTPIVPFGTGTSFEGQTNAPHGGVCIDVSRMNAILQVNADDLDCRVQPGVTRKQLNAYLRDMGLHFPIDPGADASLGGMTATRASGTNAVRYGTMKDNVLSVRVVLPDGSVMRSASRARKSSAGYDLTRLMVGSEGTLGVFTEITLRLHPIPEGISAGSCSFPSIRAACDAAIVALQAGLTIGRVELLDTALVRAVNAYSKLALPETPLLLFEFSGAESQVAEQAKQFAEIATDHGGGDFKWTTQTEERARLWQARHDAFLAALTLRPGAAPVTTDVCVPISRLAECVEATNADVQAAGFVAVVGGHIGDGNFHVTLLIDPASEQEMQAIDAFMDTLVKRAIDMDGTCTGEHGIGQNKNEYLVREFDAAGVAAMRAIKTALDPLNIMNPGKILPA
ncbi:MAG: FAD-binding oxidoreductase [Rhodoblastus sp.]